MNRNLIEENHRLINTNNEHITTIQTLELSVKELKEKCANTPVYLCEDCDYLAECVHDFNDHTHSPEEFEDLDDAQIPCKFCDETFDTISEVLNHNETIHTRKVPYCKYFIEGSCYYGDNCWFVHNETLKISEPCIKCRLCEMKFKTKNSVMEHMKDMHIQSVSNCKNENECKYGAKRCWFAHKETIEIAYEHAKNGKKISNSNILNSTLNTAT